MLRYIARRVLEMIPSLILVTIGVFALIHLIPGDPVQTMLGQDARGDEAVQLRHQLGLDRPLPIQYVDWITGVLSGDLGRSIVTKRPVADTIVHRLPVTLILTALATLISIAIAIPAGVIAAVKRNTVVDQSVLLLSLVGVTIPSFFLGILLIFFLSVRVGWFPAVGYTPLTENLLSGLHSLVLPAFSLGFLYAAVLARMTRTSLLDVLNQDYVRTARAKGLTDSAVIAGHALRNALIPVITVIGLNFGQMLGGSVVIEAVFSLPGLGSLVISSINNRDYPIIQGAILLVGVGFLLVNLIVDLLYGYFDPRIRYS